MGLCRRPVDRVVDLHLLACPVHEELFRGDINLAQDRVQRTGPLLIELAKAAAGAAVGMFPAVFLPVRLKCDTLTNQFLTQPIQVR